MFFILTGDGITSYTYPLPIVNPASIENNQIKMVNVYRVDQYEIPSVNCKWYMLILHRHMQE